MLNKQINICYSLFGSNLPKPTPSELYWSRGSPGLCDILGPIFTLSDLSGENSVDSDNFSLRGLIFFSEDSLFKSLSFLWSQVEAPNRPRADFGLYLTWYRRVCGLLLKDLSFFISNFWFATSLSPSIAVLGSSRLRSSSV